MNELLQNSDTLNLIAVLVSAGFTLASTMKSPLKKNLLPAKKTDNLKLLKTTGKIQ